MAYSLGIDLGTTSSAAATARDGRTEIVSLGEHATTIPTVVAFDADGAVLVGDAADRRSLTEPTRTARAFRRRLGDPAPIVVAGTAHEGGSLLAHILEAIVATVTEKSGGPPDAIALTHPASDGADRVRLLEEAAREAGIGDVTLVTEPEAAAIHHAEQDNVPAGAVIAVYDFGGGTFEATILRRIDDGFEQLGQAEAIERFGGIDFDDALFTSVMAQVEIAGVAVDRDDPATLAAMARLREECRRAKEALSSHAETAIHVVLPGFETALPLTREDFEGLIRPRIAETIEALRRAAESAGLDFDDVDRVLLCGGSSQIPLVAEMVGEATGRPITVDADSKESMALGAAFVAEKRRLAAAADADERDRAAEAAEAAAVAAAGASTILAIEDAAAIDAAAGAGAGSDAAGVAAGAAAAGATAVGAEDGPPTQAVPAVAATAAAGGAAPAAGATPVPTTATGAADRRRLITLVAAVAGVALVLLLAAGASGMLSGAPSSSPPPSVAAAATPSLTASLAPSPSSTPVATATPVASPTAIPSPTATPAGRQARITGIAITNDRYIVDYEVFGYQPALPGVHVHFFFDTVSVADAGIPGKGPWFLYAGPVPFTGYKVSDRPAAASRMCILVANADHSIVPDTGNCFALP